MFSYVLGYSDYNTAVFSLPSVRTSGFLLFGCWPTYCYRSSGFFFGGPRKVQDKQLETRRLYICYAGLHSAPALHACLFLRKKKLGICKRMKNAELEAEKKKRCSCSEGETINTIPEKRLSLLRFSPNESSFVVIT